MVNNYYEIWCNLVFLQENRQVCRIFKIKSKLSDKNKMIGGTIHDNQSRN